MRSTLLFAAFVIKLLLVATQVSGQVEEPETPVKATIAPLPVSGRLLAVGQSQTINGAEFEVFSLSGYAGPVSWDMTMPDDTPPPVKIFECKPRTLIIGIKAGQTGPGEYETPDSPSVAVWAIGTGRAVVAAWGVRDGKPVKIATLLIDANRGPRPPPPKPIPPTPDPLPPQPPIPPTPVPVKPEIVTVVIVDDSLQRTPQTAALIADINYWESLEPVVETCHIVPADSPIAKQYTKQIAQAGGVLPVLIVMDFKTKKVLTAQKLPADKVAMSALINSLTGK